MKVGTYCAECLYRKQQMLTNDPEYLREIKKIIDSRRENDTAPYLLFLFGKTRARLFGEVGSMRDTKKQYNNDVLAMENTIRARIEADADPLLAALVFARIGNYIDFGALNQVDGNTLLSLLEQAHIQEQDRKTLLSFKAQCRTAKRFLLIADNCGEIVLDKLFIEVLKKSFPHLKVSVLVRGKEVLNDATVEDAHDAGMDTLAEVISSGEAIAGTIYELLPAQAKAALDQADVILAKGQGNYESLYGQGRHIFYSLLCKCELFTERFHMPLLSGVFVEENAEPSCAG